jgi:hypothetical protein
MFLTYFIGLYQTLHQWQTHQEWKAQLIEKGGKNISTKKRNKRQNVRTERRNVKEESSVRIKRKEIMRQKREAKRRRTENNVLNEETSIKETRSNLHSTNIKSEIWNFGKPTCRCRHCDALL